MKNQHEVELVESESFRAFARGQTIMTLDDLGYLLYYLRLKDIEQKALGDKFILGVFLNKVRKWCREEV